MKKPVFSQAIGLGWVIGIWSSVVMPAAIVAETEPSWYTCLTREVFTLEKQIWCDRWYTLQNGTYTVPVSLVPNLEYRTVTLSHGRYQQQDGFSVDLFSVDLRFTQLLT